MSLDGDLALAELVHAVRRIAEGPLRYSISEWAGCGRCEWFLKASIGGYNAGKDGYCRRHPPRIIADEADSFPCVSALDRCGEFFPNVEERR
jgi:hypothetical protein